jgi:hypothetical protein
LALLLGEAVIEVSIPTDGWPPLIDRLELFYTQLLAGLRAAETGTVIGDIAVLNAVISDFEKVIFPESQDSSHICPVRNDKGKRCRLSIDHERGLPHLFEIPPLQRVYFSHNKAGEYKAVQEFWEEKT